MRVEVVGKGAVDLAAGSLYADLVAQLGVPDVLAVAVGERVLELFRPVEEGQVRLITFADAQGRQVFRHTASHVLAQAVKRLYPKAQLAIGPATDEGFFYDILFPVPIGTGDLAAIQAEMAKVVAEDHPLKRDEVSRAQALADFGRAGEPFKVQLIEALPEDALITTYNQGEFTDLCRGPHLARTGLIKALRLTNVAGAYFRGDDQGPMLQRVYGTAFPSAAEMDRHFFLIEEAKRRDHRKLGPELDLFSFHDVAPGFAFWHAKGLVLYEALVGFSRSLQQPLGYQEVSTPWIFKTELWETSGHSAHFTDNMFLMESEGEAFGVKPMNCPGHCLLFAEATRSYRELPLKIAEYGPLTRRERSGTLHGLLRVRGMHQDDAHIFLASEQLGSVIEETLGLVDTVYATFQMPIEIHLSTRPPSRMGDDALWDQAEAALEAALGEEGRAYVVDPGEGAFYGPKLDFVATDALGRRWQVATIQVDFQLPIRFELHYVDRDGKQKTPVMVHRAIMGSLERFIGVLVEHFAGAFPLWLAPVQVRLLPISEAERQAAGAVAKALREDGVRAEVDDRNEKIGYRIRAAEKEKIPYVAVIGQREVEAGTVAVRERGGKDLGTIAQGTFTRDLQERIASRWSGPSQLADTDGHGRA
ncbi:MAG: threonine--tRNA ligase [Sulfobacillus sp.]